MSDATSPPGQMLADRTLRAEPLRDGVLPLKELSLAGDRASAYRLIRMAESVAIDPPEHTRYRQILQPIFSAWGTARWEPVDRVLATEPDASTEVSWPAPLVGVDNLLLIFPPGGGEVRKN